jgi:4-amino-4-deoxy-L-arabinose transferase-like glycosyltransferase
MYSTPAVMNADGRRRFATGSGLGLASILLLAAAIRLWRLGDNGFGTLYYASGVRSMLESWHNFFFNAFDPAGFVSLDKPPVAFWIQVASAKLFGFGPLSILLPQAIEGVLSVAILHHLVRRRFGDPAGLLAGLFLALTPVSVAVDRSGNTESCLVLVLLLAGWVTVHAAERGSLRWLLAAMALVGVGFNVKMLAAFGVLPALVALYAFEAPLSWQRKLRDLGLSGGVLAVVSLSWIATYDLTPPDSRPYVDSTSENSMIELALGHNFIERFVHRTPRGFGATAIEPTATRPAGARLQGETRVPVGPLRLADDRLGAQFGWLLPLALFGALAELVEVRRRARGARSEALILWGGWALAYAVVFSSAGGIFHAYYLVMLAPPVAALAAIGVVDLWSLYRAPGWRAQLLPVALLATAAWQAYLGYTALDPAEGDWRSALYLVLVGGVISAAALLIAGPRSVTGWTMRAALGAGLAALLVTPTAWALTTVFAHRSTAPLVADLDLLSQTGAAGRPGSRYAGPSDRRALRAFLLANRRGERYLLATPTAQLAAPLIVETGAPVMAIGGFTGGDPILTPDELGQIVAAGGLRFVMLGGAGGFARNPDDAARRGTFIDWVRAHGTPVDPELWRGQETAAVPEGRRAQPLQLYDLNPAAGLVPATS